MYSSSFVGPRSGFLAGLSLNTTKARMTYVKHNYHHKFNLYMKRWMLNIVPSSGTHIVTIHSKSRVLAKCV